MWVLHRQSQPVPPHPMSPHRSQPEGLPVLHLQPRQIPAEGRVSRGDAGPGQGTREVQDTRTPSHSRQSWPCPLPWWQCHAGGDRTQEARAWPRQCPTPLSDEGQQPADGDDLSAKQTHLPAGHVCGSGDGASPTASAHSCQHSGYGTQQLKNRVAVRAENKNMKSEKTRRNTC